jgi:hypothetical protein
MKALVVAILLALTMAARAEDTDSANYFLPGCKGLLVRENSFVIEPGASPIHARACCPWNSSLMGRFINEAAGDAAASYHHEQKHHSDCACKHCNYCCKREHAHAVLKCEKHTVPLKNAKDEALTTTSG